MNLIDLRERIALAAGFTAEQREWLLDLLRLPGDFPQEDCPALQVLARSTAFYPILARLDPDVQGAILAELLATWIIGHVPEARGEMLRMHIRAVIDLVKLASERPHGNA